MASSRRSDWRTARDEYMKQLDERFPNHPYQEKLREWRDKILLEDAENRGKNLTSGLNISLTKPANDAERKFVVDQRASPTGHRNEATTWRPSTSGRKWLTSSRKPPSLRSRMIRTSGSGICWPCHRVEQLENAIKDRREFVEKQLQARRRGVPQRAARPRRLTIRSKLVEQFGKYTDLADLFAGARQHDRSDDRRLDEIASLRSAGRARGLVVQEAARPPKTSRSTTKRRPRTKRTAPRPRRPHDKKRRAGSRIPTQK